MRLFLFLIFSFLSLTCFASNRYVVNESIPFVVSVKYDRVKCTGFIYKPGLIITAKHCFTHSGVSELSFNSKYLNVTNIEETNEFRLQFDSGDNDFAYLIYPENLTPFSRINSWAIIEPNNLELYSIGRNLEGKLIHSGSCKFTGVNKYFPPLISDIGYDGLLSETTCPSWNGLSGSPVFMKDKDETFFVGIVSHTFEVDEFGDILKANIKKDAFGNFVETSAISLAIDTVDLVNKTFSGDE